MIVNFVVKDKGVGFTNKILESFNFACGNYKEKKNGKGTRSLLLLRSFKKVEVNTFEKLIRDLKKHNKFLFEN